LATLRCLRKQAKLVFLGSKRSNGAKRPQTKIAKPFLQKIKKCKIEFFNISKKF
jgi:hypothetical protein